MEQLNKILFLLSCILLGNTAAADALEIQNAFSRAVPPGAPMGAVYARLVNTSDELIEIASVHTNVAKFNEIHESIELDGMMRMREIENLQIPALGYVDLAPGGKHVMLMRLQEKLKKGNQFKIIIKDNKGRSYETMVTVGGYGQLVMPK